MPKVMTAWTRLIRIARAYQPGACGNSRPGIRRSSTRNAAATSIVHKVGNARFAIGCGIDCTRKNRITFGPVPDGGGVRPPLLDKAGTPCAFRPPHTQSLNRPGYTEESLCIAIAHIPAARFATAISATTVRLSGWCHRIRDHGGVLFIDLRDHYGLTQVVADPDSKAFKLAETLRAEWVVRIDGKVRQRPAGTENPELPTGQVEIYIDDIEVLGPAGELPMPVFGEQDYPEEIRLKYRFLDLRREHLHANIMLRGKVIDSIRRRMKEGGFFEFQTPILTASSPEGARDYLVPSRMHPGKFYALPQAPQQFKQLIMIAGFDRYFQIAPCFRDEDARADRSPGEFYQLDLEMSFVTQQDVFDAVEPVIRGVFEEFANGKPVTQKFPIIPYAEALRKYGTDKPDLRNPIVMQDVSEAFRGSGFKIFANILANDPAAQVWAIPAPKGGNRAFCDRMNSWAQGEGQPGLGYIFWREGEESGAGPLAKNIGPERTKQIADQLKLGVGDACFFVAGKPKDFVKFAGPARTQSRRRTRTSSPRTDSSSAGSSISRCTNGTRKRRKSTSRTTRSRCRTCRSRNSSRSIRKTMTSCCRSRRFNTTSSATAWSCRPARSAIIAPR